MKHTNEHFFVAVVIKGLTICKLKCHQKHSLVVYVMAMSSMREQKLIDYGSYFEKKNNGGEFSKM